ncbi:YbaB/EbfC family nucleoid-associated protein [Catenuloplanes sp. NPDC051500]|uniref:YbaB/EbfC family nucleoid-associated protein n=1 Tax=Catenuloplanes sp. NPDC051500 TaxID=3363959 RepID=UPI00378770C6
MDPEGMVERAARVREAVATASAEVTSENHEVTVMVGPQHTVRDLRFSPRAFRMSGAELGALVVRTLHAADAEMSVTMRETLDGILGRRS